VLFSGIAAAQVVGSTTSTIDSRNQIKHINKMDARYPNEQILKILIDKSIKKIGYF
jgi:hypothetical protein